MNEQVTQSDAPQSEMPRYKCHKEVHALKIRRVDFHGGTRDLTKGGRLIPDDGGFGPIEVSGEYLAKHNPFPPGYYVVYKDGYKSWSPVEAFEDGYTRIDA